uniref:Uncharacterized protein n=1 Tax=Plectus sambesii TaxID=2011161 RepID=A0A914X480_9BILA
MCVGFLIPAAGADADGTLLARYALEGLAAGTFVYVACVEMLSSELGHSHDRSGLLKAMFVVLGVITFLIISALSKAEREGGSDLHGTTDHAH